MMPYKIYITVEHPLSNKEFTLETSVDPELPYNEYVQAIDLISILDRDYPDWQRYEIDVDIKQSTTPDIPDVESEDINLETVEEECTDEN